MNIKLIPFILTDYKFYVGQLSAFSALLAGAEVWIPVVLSAVTGVLGFYLYIEKIRTERARRRMLIEQQLLTNQRLKEMQLEQMQQAIDGHVIITDQTGQNENSTTPIS
ncbi:MAG: hypothetical protein AAF738_10155 [Bacteroidota bacterium]